VCVCVCVYIYIYIYIYICNTYIDAYAYTQTRTRTHTHTHTHTSKTQKLLENFTLTRKIKKSAPSFGKFYTYSEDQKICPFEKEEGAATAQYLALPTATSIHLPPCHTSPTKTHFTILLAHSRLPFGLVTQTFLIPRTHYVAPPSPSPFFSVNIRCSALVLIHPLCCSLRLEGKFQR